MRSWDRVLKVLSKVFRVVNNSTSMSLAILIGSPISVYLFADLLNSPSVEHHFLLTVIIVLLPFLLYKMLLYFLLACFDFILIATTDFNKSYDVDMEKVRARVTKVMMERKVAYQSLETIALGLEKDLLQKMRQILHMKYPLIYVATDKPFVVVKIFRAISSPNVQRLMKQLENKERVGVRIFAEETNEAKVLSKVIINSLEFLNKEDDVESGDSGLEETK
ncbi:MAG: hypothetical protein V1658_00770 [Candidatus Micrarchaeota archaeon]